MAASPLSKKEQICKTFQKCGMEFLEVSADSLIKKNFRNSDSLQTRLLIETVSSIIGRSNFGRYLLNVNEKCLSDYEVKSFQVANENVAPAKVGVPKTKAASSSVDVNDDTQSSKCKKITTSKKTNTESGPSKEIAENSKKIKELPKDPRADLSYVVTLVPKQGENMTGTEEIKCGYEIEVQRFTGEPYYVAREVQYAHGLHCDASKGNEKVKLRKTYGCMFHFSDSYTSNKELMGINLSDKNVVSSADQVENFPVCCAFVFLGKRVQAAEIVIKYLENVRKDIKNGKAASAGIKEGSQEELKKNFDEETSKLTQKYENFFKVNLKKCRNFVKKFCESKKISVGDHKGYKASDFDSNPKIKEKFNHIERFELLQLLAFSNLAQSSVVDELFSNTVKGLYMSNKITSDNIDDGYVDELWYQQEALASKNEALAAKSETLQAQNETSIFKAALKIRNSFKSPEGTVSIDRVQKIVDPDGKLKGQDLDSRVRKVVDTINENDDGSGFQFEIKGKNKNRYLEMVKKSN